MTSAKISLALGLSLTLIGTAFLVNDYAKKDLLQKLLDFAMIGSSSFWVSGSLANMLKEIGIE